MKILSLGSQTKSGQAASAVSGLVIGGHGMAVKGIAAVLPSVAGLWGAEASFPGFLPHLQKLWQSH